MRYDARNQRSGGAASGAGSTSLKPVIAVGKQGEPGLNGSNVLPTDVAIAQAVNTPASATSTALSAQFIQYVKPSGDTTGVTDTANLQAALDAGKFAYLTGATYWVKDLHPRSNTGILFNKATLKLPNGANTDVIVNEDFDTLTGSGSMGGVASFVLHGPGDIDGNAANQTIVNPTVNQSNFDLSPSFTLKVSDSSTLGNTGRGTVRTFNGIQNFTWSANDTATNTLTCSSGTTGRVEINGIVCTKGYGVRVYGRSFRFKDVDIHNCVADNLYTEWGPGNTGVGTDEMESFFESMKLYEAGRNGHTFNGPHDSEIRSCVWFRNKSRGVITGNSSIGYFTGGHAWGFPQVVGIEDSTQCQYFGTCSEAVGTGSRAWVIWKKNSSLNGVYVLSASGSGAVGIELRGSGCQGIRIDATFGNAFTTAPVLLNGDAGGHYIRGIVSDAGSSSPVSGTPHSTDVIDLIPGSGSTFARYTQGYARSTSIFVGSARLYNAQGSAATGTVGSDVTTRTGVWLLDAASAEGVATVIDVPEGWSSATVSLVWTNVAATSGDVSWRAYAAQVDPADSHTTAATQIGSTTVATAPSTIGNGIKTTLGTVTFTGKKLLRLGALRKADDAADTLANDAGLIGILVERAS